MHFVVLVVLRRGRCSTFTKMKIIIVVCINHGLCYFLAVKVGGISHYMRQRSV
jgi:hypothetical protein